MFIVNGSNVDGIVTSNHNTMVDALAKASEFINAGFFNVTILDLDKNTYREAEIDLLLDMLRSEHRKAPKA